MKYPIALPSVVISLEMFEFGSHFLLTIAKNKTAFSATLVGKFDDIIMHTIPDDAVLEILQFAESIGFYDLCTKDTDIGDVQIALNNDEVVLNEESIQNSLHVYWTITVETDTESVSANYSTEEPSWRFSQMAECILRMTGFAERELKEVM